MSWGLTWGQRFLGCSRWHVTSNSLCTKMTITEIARSRFVMQIFTAGGGNKREFTSYRGGAVEVYDFPGKAGLPRFLGYLDTKMTTKLYQLAAEWEGRQP